MKCITFAKPLNKDLESSRIFICFYYFPNILRSFVSVETSNCAVGSGSYQLYSLPNNILVVAVPDVCTVRAYIVRLFVAGKVGLIVAFCFVELRLQQLCSYFPLPLNAAEMKNEDVSVEGIYDVISCHVSYYKEIVKLRNINTGMFPCPKGKRRFQINFSTNPRNLPGTFVKLNLTTKLESMD
uniref:Uncharacterized protein n=1 Tax=Glossina pallidipes TaxID=7398 RepID=A0A1A9ZU20_GLOPL